MYHQGSVSFITAAALSLVAHATAAVYFGHYRSPESAAPQSAPTLQLSLTAARPAPPQAAPEPVPEPEVAPPPEIQPPPKPVQKPVPKPVPKPVARPKPRPRPVLQKPPPTEIAETAPIVPIPAVAAARTVADKPVLAPVPQVSERESYLARLLAHIDSHKFYPRSARRRGIIGEVKVSFYLHRDGSIEDLQITGGSKVLRKAARQAIYNAQSLPKPPDTLGLQEPIQFGMVYRLEG